MCRRDALVKLKKLRVRCVQPRYHNLNQKRMATRFAARPRRLHDGTVAQVTALNVAHYATIANWVVTLSEHGVIHPPEPLRAHYLKMSRQVESIEQLAVGLTTLYVVKCRIVKSADGAGQL